MCVVAPLCQVQPTNKRKQAPRLGGLRLHHGRLPAGRQTHRQAGGCACAYMHMQERATSSSANRRCDLQGACAGTPLLCPLNHKPNTCLSTFTPHQMPVKHHSHHPPPHPHPSHTHLCVPALCMRLPARSSRLPLLLMVGAALTGAEAGRACCCCPPVCRGASTMTVFWWWVNVLPRTWACCL